MSQEIELYSKLQSPMDAIQQMGKFFAKSGMFGCDREEQGQVLAMICITEQMTPVALMRSYDIIDGKLHKKSMACLADFRRAGGKYKWLNTGDKGEGDAQKAVGEFTFDGQVLTVEYSLADARRQGLLRPNSNWIKSPGNMLRARCASNAVGMLAPEILAGDDSEESTTPVAALNLPTVVASPVAAPTQPAKEPETIKDAVIVPEPAKPATANPDAAAEAAQGLAPTFRAVAAGAGIDNDTVRAIRIALTTAKPGVDLDTVAAALTGKKWITNNDVATLTTDRAQRILDQPAAFLKGFNL